LRDLKLLVIQFAEAFGQDDFNAACGGVDLHANVLRERNQQFTLRRIHLQNWSSLQILARKLHVANATHHRSTVALVDFAANQIADVETAGRKSDPFAERNLDFETNELFSF
jgi:hypothetical protein